MGVFWDFQWLGAYIIKQALSFCLSNCRKKKFAKEYDCTEGAIPDSRTFLTRLKIYHRWALNRCPMHLINPTL